METPTNESDISPLLPDANPKENNIKNIECCDFLQCCACILIVFLSCCRS